MILCTSLKGYICDNLIIAYDILPSYNNYYIIENTSK
jgi:hypothetical protein